MTLRPVHCCCTPGLRLGWVPVPIELTGDVCLWLRPERPLVFGDVSAKLQSHTLRVRVMLLSLPGARPFIAVHSNDHPIETWRRVNGFAEDQAVVMDEPLQRTPATLEDVAHFFARALTCG